MPTYSQLTKQERESYQERAKKALEHWGIEPSDYRRLAVIEHQLQRWYEQECNGEIERCEETGKVYRVIGHDQPGATIRRLPYKDMETGAMRVPRPLPTNTVTTTSRRSQGVCCVFLVVWRAFCADYWP